MVAFLSALRKPLGLRLLSLLTLGSLAACGPLPVRGPLSGPTVGGNAPVEVAMLLPLGDTGGASDVARSLENAARLAASDLVGAQIDLTVYDTASGTTAAASQAITEGAQIILGPLYAQNTTEAARVAAGSGINVLSFSNNTAVAGGNVFVLGPTFNDIASRLSSYAARNGRSSIAVVHADDVSGNAGRDAIVDAARSAGLSVATVQGYPLSQQGIVEAGPRIAEAIEQTGADAVFLTANVDSDLPLIASTLPENGIDPAQTRYLGLTRWNAAPQALSLPGLQGGLFTLPDQSVQAQFEARYRAAYGSAPHPLAGLAYDAVQAVGSLAANGSALNAVGLTQPSGFAGATGVFRLLPNGTNQRGLAVAQVQNNQVVILDPAPRRFGSGGY
ncbi:ABC-type branched-subunit amino acid transport system substrate-binding protein [Palleronia aestuarii]|uniref:ABC-type branched-subunit amino acid transport system substrate-binding protein n=1 Tax=Palleronia aestuarii TaxID=568105 RepID=A0A2W7NP57_9RHOB|nr:penicillin-binding protein activator [Palleronia aestuarii]PZX18394.1 ABC-type branched-subunit amino acid transport system substrate-binding protein [Palleronia aestuarii]